MIDLAGHLAYVLLIIGSILTGNMKRTGWLFRFAGSASWVVLGIFMGYSSIVIWSAAFAVTDYRNWRKWNETLPETKNQAG